MTAVEIHSKSEAPSDLALCSVRVGEQMYGVDINQVMEILGPSPLRMVPCAPHFIGGLVPYRGEVLTTVSLRALFEMPQYTAQSSVLVVEGGSGPYGLLVDAVDEVVQVRRKNFEPVPSTLEAKRGALLHGTYKLKSGLLIQLDPQRLDPMGLIALTHGIAA